MADHDDHRKQFDRFAQDRYLRRLLETDPDAVIETLFPDLMERVNTIQGEADLILAEVARARSEKAAVDGALVEQNTVKLLESVGDVANILKALMEYDELRQGGEDNVS